MTNGVVTTLMHLDICEMLWQLRVQMFSFHINIVLNSIVQKLMLYYAILKVHVWLYLVWCSTATIMMNLPIIERDEVWMSMRQPCISHIIELFSDRIRSTTMDYAHTKVSEQGPKLVCYAYKKGSYLIVLLRNNEERLTPEDFFSS